AHDVRAHGFHFAKVGGEDLEIFVPEIFHESTVIAVVEAPRVKRLFGLREDEAFVIRRNDDAFHGRAVFQRGFARNENWREQQEQQQSGSHLDMMERAPQVSKMFEARNIV
ncbi:MAG: hypothetical protein JWO95_3126, partial [Verrucomicrobiales bacterium]|nr:hypothetical protein [Verrucomicrobiales bacterium]